MAGVKASSIASIDAEVNNNIIVEGANIISDLTVNCQNDNVYRTVGLVQFDLTPLKDEVTDTRDMDLSMTLTGLHTLDEVFIRQFGDDDDDIIGMSDGDIISSIYPNVRQTLYNKQDSGLPGGDGVRHERNLVEENVGIIASIANAGQKLILGIEGNPQPTVDYTGIYRGATQDPPPTFRYEYVGSDPFTRVYNELWEILEDSSGFTSLVPSANRIKYVGEGRERYEKEVLSSADVPEVRITWDGSAPQLNATSQSLLTTERFSIAVRTGNMSLERAAFPVRWEVLRAMSNWQARMLALLFRGERFVIDVRMIDVEDSQTDGEDSRGVSDWASIWAGEVRMQFPFSLLEV